MKSYINGNTRILKQGATLSFQVAREKHSLWDTEYSSTEKTDMFEYLRSRYKRCGKEKLTGILQKIEKI